MRAKLDENLPIESAELLRAAGWIATAHLKGTDLKTWVHASVVLWFFTVAVGGQVPDDSLIVPGEGIGRWKLTMTVPAVENMVRPPNLPADQGSGRIDRRPGNDVVAGVATIVWPQALLGMGINVDEDAERGLYLLTVSREFRTKEGVGPGVPVKLALGAYGKPTAVTSPGGRGLSRHIYGDLSIAFVVEGTNVIQVFVFSPGAAARIWRM